MSASRVRGGLCAVVVCAVVGACSPGSPFPTPFASEHEVPRHVLADMLTEQQRLNGNAPVTVNCDRGVAPGSGQVSLCTVVYDNGDTATFGVSLTSDSQIVARYR